MEIYNESINDLLNPGCSNLKTQEDITVRATCLFEVWGCGKWFEEAAGMEL